MNKQIPLAFLPIDTIVADPIDYLTSRGLHVSDYEYRTLSDFGLGPPVIRYHIHAGDGGKTFIAKWHEPDEGACVYSLLRALWDAGFAHDEALRIAEPWEYIDGKNILLQMEARGLPLLSFMDDLVAALGPVQMAARWLAKLHTLPNFQPACSEFNALSPVAIGNTLRRHHDALCERLPSLALRFHAVARRINHALAERSVGGTVPTHGDYHPKNIYVHDNNITLIDFDRFALSHAERDLGYFVAQSMTMSYAQHGSFQQIANWNSAFLDEYQRCGVPINAGLLGAYVGLAFVEVLFYRLCVRPVADDSFVTEWLDACVQLMSSSS